MSGNKGGHLSKDSPSDRMRTNGSVNHPCAYPSLSPSLVVPSALKPPSLNASLEPSLISLLSKKSAFDWRFESGFDWEFDWEFDLARVRVCADPSWSI